jgi:hypothetical protein
MRSLDHSNVFHGIFLSCRDELLKDHSGERHVAARREE